LESIGLAITFSSASDPANQMENLVLWVRLLQSWVRGIMTSQDDPLLWRGLKYEVLVEMYRSGIQEEADETMIFAALMERYPFSVVWYEEVSSEEIQAKYYPYSYQGYWSFFLYLGNDLRGNIYAFHHAEQSNISSSISYAIAGPESPVVLPVQLSPNEQFISIASLIVQSCQQLPPGVLSDRLQESVQEYSSRWRQLDAKLPSDLPTPLDNVSLGSVLNTLMRFPSAPTLVRTIPEHAITECARYPTNLIPHGQTPQLHYFHVQCLRKFAQARLIRQPGWQARCPLCTDSFTPEVLTKLTQDLGPDERTSSLRLNY
jgi:hypothetical protein